MRNRPRRQAPGRDLEAFVPRGYNPAGPRPVRMRRRSAHVLLALYVAVAASALVWPAFPAAMERLPARVLGLPCALFWSVAWIVLTFLVVLAYHRADRPERTP